MIPIECFNGSVTLSGTTNGICCEGYIVRRNSRETWSNIDRTFDIALSWPWSTSQTSSPILIGLHVVVRLDRGNLYKPGRISLHCPSSSRNLSSIRRRWHSYMKPIGCYNGSYGQEKIDNIGSQSYVENSNGGVVTYVIVPKILLSTPSLR